MIKNISKRVAAIMVTIAIVLTTLTAGIISASAAPTLSVEGLTISTTGSATWSGSGTSVNGTVSGKNGVLSFLNSAQNGTLTFSNQRDDSKSATLSFSYNITKNTGSVTIAGSTVTGSGTFSKSLEFGDTVAVKITSGKGTSNTTAIDITNIALTVVADSITTTFKTPENGSYTVNDTAITEDTPYESDPLVQYALAATPATGYKFAGWYSSVANGYVSYAASATLQVVETTSIYPVFISSATPTFKVGNNTYTNLNEANAAAKNASDKLIVLTSSGTLPAGNYEISAGVKLLIPFDASETADFDDKPGTVNARKSGVYAKPTEFRKLTLSDGAVINCYGQININAQMYVETNVYTSQVTGPYGAIDIIAGGELVLESGSTLWAYGYVGGDGAVIGKAGSAIYQMMQICDWRGGTATSSLSDKLKNNSFLFSQYYLQNIEACLKVYSGSTMYAVTGLTMDLKLTIAEELVSAPIIGTDNGLFRFSANRASDYMTLKYDSATDRMNLELYGQISTVSIDMSVTLGITTYNLNTDEYILPIPMNYSIYVKEGSTVSFTEKFKLLPGTEIIVDNGASVTVGANGAVYLYDVDDWLSGKYAHVEQIYQLRYVHTTKGAPVSRKLDKDSVLQIDGTLNAMGPIYSTNYTENGGDACITGNGTVTIGAHGTVNLLEVNNNETGSLVTVSCVPVLGKLVGHEGNVSLDIGTYKSINGQWYQYTMTVDSVTVVSGALQDGGTIYVANAKDAPANVIVTAAQPCVSATNAKVVNNNDGTYTVTDFKGNTNVVAKTHTLKDVAAIAPDCVNPGHTAGVMCEVCGVYTTPTTEIPALGHKEEIIPGKDATCTETGLTEGKKCSVCDTILVEQQVTPALGHTHETIPGKEATCTETGLTAGEKCSVCQVILTEQTVIAALGHDHSYVVEGTYKAPTCIEDGKEADMKCVRCDDIVEGAVISATGHNYSVVIEGSEKAPTCTVEGKEVDLKCANCDSVQYGAVIPATDHDEVIDAEAKPTCTETGLTQGSHCAICGETIIAQEVVDALGHDYVAVVTAPTCTHDGYTTHTCSVCGDSYVDTYVDSTGDEHNYDSFGTVNPTCTTEGYTYAICSICGHESKLEQTVKPALGHYYEYAVLTPTCTEGGHTARTCQDCGYSDIVDYTDPLGHDCVPTVTHPTCTEQGYTTHNCSRCDYTHIPADSYKPAYGHQYEQSLFSATCTEGGYTKFECFDCGHIYIPDESRTEALGHCYYKDYIEVIITKPTCTEQGYTTHNCYCGEHSHTLNYVPATGHSYGEWVTTVPATCTEDGERTKTCAGCGDIIKEAIPATGHNHISAVTAPTCTEKGYTTFTCECGDTYIDNYVDAKGHIEVVTPGRDPSCKEAGLTEGKHCSVCGEVLIEQVEIEKLAHSFGDWTTSKVPSCTAEGEEARMCSVCGTNETRPLAMTEHTVVIDPAVPARYDKTGLTEGSHCSVCNEVLVAQETVEKLILNWETFKEGLQALEYYASVYAKSNPGKDPMKLMINFLRTGVDRYNDDEWQTMAGAPETSFIKDVLAYDDIYGTHAYALREMDGLAITMPNGENMEFDHLFGALNVSSKNNYGQNNTDFGSWIGDLCDLLKFTNESGVKAENFADIEALVKEVNKYFGNYSGTAITGSFGWADVKADLDVFYITDKIVDGETSLLKIFEEYYIDDLSDVSRAAYFLNNRFPGSMTKEAVRESIFTTYKNNFLVQLLESGRGLSSLTELRQACCYTFADYLYNLAKDHLVAPEEEDKPGEGEEENKVYNVVDSTTQNIAPGVTQTSNQAYNADGKQIYFYTATADITRGDVHIFANYANNDPSKGWEMTKVSEQMNAALNKHSDPNDTANYVENYNPVVGVNGSFYDMENGEPNGLLVMEGVTYKEGGNNFFALLKDGTPVISDKSGYAALKDEIQEALVGGTILVKDGVSLHPESKGDRAPRTAIGITADGKIVLMVIDGRQEPISAGANYHEMAEIMLDAGCVAAMELDGGGSSTFVAKPEGSNDLSVINRPSDRSERSVSSSVLIVSTAPTSKEFDHAVVNTDTNYITVGSSFDISLIGVGAAGNTAEIPEGATLQVSDAAKGSISGNKFTALAVGKVDIQLVLNGNVVGAKTINVIRRPTALSFSENNINVIYGVAKELPLVATYNNNAVTINSNDVVFSLSNGAAGVMNGFAFIGNEASKVRNLTITAKVAEDATVSASMSLRLYSADESIFDFANATAGNESLAWNREVVNTFTINNKDFYLVDSSKDIYANYTFAIDMKAITAPVRLQPLMEYLNGFADGVDGNGSPWDYLLALGGRVSELTNITIRATFPEGVTVDIADIKFVNDFFTIKDYTYNEATRTMTIKCTWNKQSAGIDASTANSVAILSGVRLIPNDEGKDVNGKSFINVTGSIEYDIYLDTSQLHAFAKDPENQVAYGIYDYINPNDPEDAGGHFADTYINFEDTFTINDSKLNGWITGGADNDLCYYYIDNEMVTGIKAVPDFEGSGKTYYYNFGTDGISSGRYTGLFFDESAKVWKYSKIGEIATGWHEINGNWHYFWKYLNGAAAKGTQKINTTGVTYQFNEQGMTKGAWVTDEIGTRYWYGPGRYVARQEGYLTLREIDGKIYNFNGKGYVTPGIHALRDSTSYKRYVYEFDETGAMIRQITEQGPVQCADAMYYVNEYGISVMDAGLVEFNGDYYFVVWSGKLVQNANRNITAENSNGLIAPGIYKFADDGKMIKPNQTGLVPIGGQIYYYSNGAVAKNLGLIKLGNDYYYVTANGTVARSCTLTISTSKMNGYFKGGDYTFRADGTMIPPFTGIKNVDGVDYYYLNGEIGQDAGLIKLGDDYYFVVWSGKIAKGQNRNITAANSNGLIVPGIYPFDAAGKMVKRDYTGIVSWNDGDYYYIDGSASGHLGLIKLGEDYYYASTNGKLSKNCVVNITAAKANGYVTAGSYAFDADGKLIKTDYIGIMNVGGVDYYYANGKIGVNAGLVKIGDDYYYATATGEIAKNCTLTIAANKMNGYFKAGEYKFFADGKMELPFTGIKSIDGVDYYYLNGEIGQNAGLIKLGDDYYFVVWSGKIVKDAKRNITEANSNGLIKPGIYYFDAEGKMVVPFTGIKNIDGVDYYVVDDKICQNAGLVKIGDDYYFVVWSGKIVKNANRNITVENSNGYFAPGIYYFDSEGKMVIPYTGIKEIDGIDYYVVEGEICGNAGLIKLGDDYYFVVWSGKIVKNANRNITVENSNGYFEPGIYRFGADGKMVK